MNDKNVDRAYFGGYVLSTIMDTASQDTKTIGAILLRNFHYLKLLEID